MTVSIRQLHPYFFGEVSGVDLRQPLTPQEAADIEAGMDRYAVLLFRDQDITDDQQMAFALNFGERENPRGGNIVKPQDSRLSTGLNDVSNLGKDGKPLPRESRVHLFNLGNGLWHSDSSFRSIPAKFSLLSARVVNPKGGNTEFADMRAAYDALDDESKAEIEDMICEHSLMYSRGSLGFLDYTEEEKQMFKPVLQRLVRTHPVHGRKSLYLSSHAGGIVGMTVPEARLLLRDLTEHRPRDVGQPPDHAPRPPLRPVAAARHAPRHGGRHSAYRRATGGGVEERRIRTNTSSSLRTQGPIRRAISCKIGTPDKGDGATIAITIGFWDYGSLRSQGRRCMCVSRRAKFRYACPASFDSMPGSIPILRSARRYFSSTSPPKIRSGSASQCSQPLSWISVSSCPGAQPA